MKVPSRKIIFRLLTIVLAIILLIIAWRVYQRVSSYFNPKPLSSTVSVTTQSFDYPVYYNEQTQQYEKLEPLPETEPVDEKYIQTKVTAQVENPTVGDEIFLTPSNNSKTDWLIVDSYGEGTVKRITVGCDKIMGVSELASRGPVFIQIDIQIDGEWVFGTKQALNAHEICQFVLPQRSPFRCYIWKPEGSDWICEYSYTVRWW